MVNWWNIHNGFYPSLQEEWEQLGFSYNECKNWISVGLKPWDAKFANYLHKQGKNPEWVLNYDNIKELRRKYAEGKKITDARNWADIHPDFAKEWARGKNYQKLWEKEYESHSLLAIISVD